LTKFFLEIPLDPPLAGTNANIKVMII